MKRQTDVHLGFISFSKRLKTIRIFWFIHSNLFDRLFVVGLAFDRAFRTRRETCWEWWPYIYCIIIRYTKSTDELVEVYGNGRRSGSMSVVFVLFCFFVVQRIEANVWSSFLFRNDDEFLLLLGRFLRWLLCLFDVSSDSCHSSSSTAAGQA